MGEIGNLQLGNIEKKKESLNKTAGINTDGGVFNTKSEYENPGFQTPYMNRVEELANKGPLMQSRIHTKNSNDIALKNKVSQPEGSVRGEAIKSVKAEETEDVIKAQSDLKVFSGNAMEKGTFSPKAKEAARHFFKQLSDWAGSFDGKVYGEMGINTVLDCLYVDGMSLRNYVKEQYLFKGSGDPVQDKETLRNYVALIAARGQHVITLVRPNVKKDEGSVEFKNLNLDLTNVGENEAAKSRKLKEKGNQVRRDLKKRMEREMTKETGMAMRKTLGYEADGFKRIEGASDALKGAKGEDSSGYKSFKESFDNYESGLQKLGLKPGRDDINAAVAGKLKEHCEHAIEEAESFLKSSGADEKTVDAVRKAKKELETDLILLKRAIDTRLNDKNTIGLIELFDSSDLPGDSGDNGDDGEASGGSDDNTGEGDI